MISKGRCYLLKPPVEAVVIVDEASDSVVRYRQAVPEAQKVDSNTLCEEISRFKDMVQADVTDQVIQRRAVIRASAMNHEGNPLWSPPDPGSQALGRLMHTRSQLGATIRDNFSTYVTAISLYDLGLAFPYDMDVIAGLAKYGLMCVREDAVPPGEEVEEGYE